MKIRVVFIAAVLGLAACTTAPKRVASVNPRVSVMTMNVENLFDLQDDPIKNDESFLPIEKKRTEHVRNKCYYQNSSDYRQQECLNADWSEAVLERKFKRLTDVLKQVNNGRGPDILILQEVENRPVLEMWRDGYLQAMNYQTISHLEGADERGIDTAVMSRLPMVGEPTLHEIDQSKVPGADLSDIRQTRGILETHLRMPNGDEMAVLSVHFPSQGAPTENRKYASERLLEVANALPAGMPVIVGGDFNITSTEDWKHHYYRDIMEQRFAVSHHIGCEGCPGTTYYHKDRTWSFFDVLLFSKDMIGRGSWVVDTSSIRIPKDSIYQINRYGSPAKFGNGYGTVGVTDHFPMYAELELNKTLVSSGDKK
ncbi:MAG: endonuclease/exonuclease/phosphatase family protein [Bdellovibrionales bacterium]